jgi:hypothetical protein
LLNCFFPADNGNNGYTTVAHAPRTPLCIPQAYASGYVVDTHFLMRILVHCCSLDELLWWRMLADTPTKNDRMKLKKT